MDGAALAIIIPIIGTVLAVGFALATLIMRSTSRVDADRRELQRTMAAFQAAMQGITERHALAMQGITERHAADMQRLAERQSHVEGRLDERGAAAD